MRLSSKSEYAFLALILLAERYEADTVCSITDIAKKQDIPKKYLEQILLMLKHGGYVKSYKGAAGGYKLAKKPRQICAAEIIRLMDGALAPVESVSKYFYEPTPIEKSKKLLAVFRQIRDYISNTLEKVTLADLL